MSRYAPLTRYLNRQDDDAIRISFSAIEQILGRALPQSAATHRAFWSNNASNNVMTRAWLAAGFRSEQVDLPGRTVVFRRMDQEGKMSGFEEACTPFVADESPAADKLALFGWQKGTVTVAAGVDLCEPADPDWANLTDEYQAPSA